MGDRAGAPWRLPLLRFDWHKRTTKPPGLEPVTPCLQRRGMTATDGQMRLGRTLADGDSHIGWSQRCRTSLLCS